MIERSSAGERDRATDRAASAARTLATVAHNAACEYVKRDVVAAQADWPHADMVRRLWFEPFRPGTAAAAVRLDNAERERQARLRRWQTPPHPTRRTD